MTQRYESEEADVSLLGRALQFEYSGVTAQNRFLKAAMTERLSSWDPKNHKLRGIPSQNLVNLYKRWGEGKYGVILSGNIMIEPDQLEAKGNPIIPKNAPFSGERFEAFKALGAEAKKHGSLIVGQVSHPGRQVPKDIQSSPISASDVWLKGHLLGMSFAKPRPASEQDIKNIVDGFAYAAEYLYTAGYDGVQLHGAHGYLLAQFLSKSTNLRTDQYGGSLENRARIIIEIAQEVRKRTPKTFVLGIKINSVEFEENGFSPEESKELCRLLESNRFDFVELTGGTYESMAFEHKRESTKKREGFFIEFAERVVPGLGKTKAYVTGGFKTAGAMVRALETVDGVGLGRPTTQEPDLPRVILEGNVKGSIKTTIDQQNFGLTWVGAGSQIKQIGKDEQPIDLARDDHTQILLKNMDSWNNKIAADTDGYLFGFADLLDFEANPYGQHYSTEEQAVSNSI